MKNDLKHLVVFCFGLFGMVAIAIAQPKITLVEYYIDKDPGYGNANKISITSAVNLQNLSVSINPALLRQGAHVMGLRARDASGAWSLDNKWLFIKDTALAKVPDIVSAEYFIDNDPGYSNGNRINIKSSANLQNVAININVNSLQAGAHLLGIRAKDKTGAWSIDNKWLFIKDTTLSKTPNIINAEYFVDNDPGYGKATTIDITPGINLQNLFVNINPGLLKEGAHVFGVRAEDANGAWSHDNRWLFVKDSTLAKIPDLVNAEYYIDNDPGYGKAAKIDIVPGTNLPNLFVNVNIDSLSIGSHIFGVRARDTNGAWSIDNKWQFTIKTSAINLLDFAVVSCDDKSLLNWKTTGTMKADYFIVQHGSDTVYFSNISKNTAYNNSSTAKSYTAIDQSPDNGINYYRLQMVGEDGKCTYSKVVPVIVSFGQPFAIYPNPVKNILHVQMQCTTAENVSLQVIDGQGKIIVQQAHQLLAGANTLLVNTSFLAKGIYQIVVKGKDTQYKMFVKE